MQVKFTMYKWPPKGAPVRTRRWMHYWTARTTDEAVDMVEDLLRRFPHSSVCVGEPITLEQVEERRANRGAFGAAIGMQTTRIPDDFYRNARERHQARLLAEYGS